MRRAHVQPVAVSSRARRCVLVALLSVVIFAGAAAAANACAQDVISDWADNGTVDATYPVKCYENAIAQLPEDLLSYSTAAEDIDRALQQVLLDDAASNGDSDRAPSSDGGGGSAEEAPTEEPDEGGGNAPAAPEPAAPAPAAPDPPAVEPPPPAEAPEAAEGDALASAADAELGDGSGSLPLPVIIVLVLVGVAIVGAGTLLVLRGSRARRDGQQ
jgi:hypothetical protein